MYQHIYKHMSILLLKEIALRYMEKDGKKQFWDFYAMYDLWRTVGSGGTASSPTSEKRQAMVDNVFEQVTKAFAKTIIANLIKFGGYKLKEDVDRGQVSKFIKQLMSGLKMSDWMEVYSAIDQMMDIEQKTSSLFFGRFGVSPADIKAQKRISIGNPARYLQFVSPIVARLIRNNYQVIGGQGDVGAELEKPEILINASRGEFSDTERETLMNLGLSIIAPGNATANIIRGMIRVHLDKLKDGRFLFYTLDKSTIEVFPTFEETVQYIMKDWRKKLPVQGFDRVYRPPAPAAPKPAPEPEPQKPVVPPAPANIQQPTMAGDAPKRLGGQWEAVFQKYGYDWNEEKKQYINPKTGVKIEVFPNNSIQAYAPDGRMRQYPNLGTVLRMMAHNKRRRHPAETPAAPAGEPKAQVTEADYKNLYRFLYT